MKFILYLFEGASGLSINFTKSYLYSTNYGFQPSAISASILNCARDCLPLTYLGVPISGRRPKREDWKKLTSLVRTKLLSWKATYLSLGGRLTLLNSVLSSIPTYWMSVFKLPSWVIKEIDKVRRDFLWKGPDLGSKGFRLVAWDRICRPRSMGGWGILNLHSFNNALLAKWWWKIFTGQQGCWSKIIRLNYLSTGPPGPLFHSPPRNKSFFWAGITPFLPAFRACTAKSVHNGASTFFWFDNWLGSRAPKDIWPDLFDNCLSPWITIRHLLQHTSDPEPLFREVPIVALQPLLQSLPDCSSPLEDESAWTLEKNCSFSVRSFYNFLVDGGMRSPLSSSFWKVDCPSKVTLFCWLASDNKILTLSNLAKKRCNFHNATDTCVLCYNDSETVDHLLIHCNFASRIWAFYASYLNLQSFPISLEYFWSSWIPSLDLRLRSPWDLLSRAIFWTIWLERNNRIFNCTFNSTSSILFKISHLFIDWCSAAKDSTQLASSDTFQSVKRSLDFLSARSADLASSSTRPQGLE